jgi:hypothetical protein
MFFDFSNGRVAPRLNGSEHRESVASTVTPTFGAEDCPRIRAASRDDGVPDVDMVNILQE